MKQTTIIPFSVLDPEDEERELEVTFDWVSGYPPAGLSGPPEDYDPGSGDEFYILSVAYIGPHDVHIPYGFGQADDDKIIEWLDEHWERPEPEDYDFDGRWDDDD